MSFISRELLAFGLMGFISMQVAKKVVQFPFVRKSLGFYVQVNTSLCGRVSQMAPSSLTKNHLRVILFVVVAFFAVKDHFKRKEGVGQPPRPSAPPKARVLYPEDIAQRAKMDEVSRVTGRSV